MDRFAQRLRDVSVRRGLRCDHVEGAAYLVVQGEDDGADGVVERDERHVLLAAADGATGADLERKQELLQGATLLRQDHAEPDLCSSVLNTFQNIIYETQIDRPTSCSCSRSL